jgi:hypothetical protein
MRVRDHTGVPDERFTIRAVPADRSPARELLAAMVDEVSAFYGRIDAPGMPSAPPAGFGGRAEKAL